jgi:hypothetical protein
VHHSNRLLRRIDHESRAKRRVIAADRQQVVDPELSQVRQHAPDFFRIRRHHFVRFQSGIVEQASARRAQDRPAVEMDARDQRDVEPDGIPGWIEPVRRQPAKAVVEPDHLVTAVDRLYRCRVDYTVDSRCGSPANDDAESPGSHVLDPRPL